jgi:hypothetical protein
VKEAGGGWSSEYQYSAGWLLTEDYVGAIRGLVTGGICY